jgi:hypothetical protein
MNKNFFKFALIVLIAAAIPTLLIGKEKLKIPAQNIKKGIMPDIKGAHATSKLVLKAIKMSDMKVAKWAFFPENIFNELKDIKWPGAYHKKLLKWFAADIKRENSKFANVENLKFKEFKVGRCRWKKVGSEYNKIAYWSCYRNKFVVSDGKKEYEIELRAMINWGNDWFVTHLGPIPKE